MGSVVSLRRGETEPYSALLPEGEYRLKFQRHKLLTRFGRGVLELWFCIGDTSSPDYGKQVVRYYSVVLSKKARSFTAKPGSNFVRDYAAVFGGRPNFSRSPLEDFRDCLVVGRVETVKRDHRQKTLPETLKYSTVRELIRRAE